VAFPKDRSVPDLREVATRGDRAGVVVAEPAIVRRVGWTVYANRLAAACTGACYECALASTECVEACLAEDAAGLKRCIWVSQNTADVCLAVGRLLSRAPDASAGEIGPILRVCMLACRMGQTETQTAAGSLDTCRAAAEACRRCESACRRLAASLATRRSAIPSPVI
jgi:hypothetical protein